MPGPGFWGGLGGAFKGLSQGLQLLMQLKQAEADRARQARMDEFALDAPERALEAKSYDALLNAGVQISPQDYRAAAARRTPGMPGMQATSALAQAAGLRGALPTPEISLGGEVAGAKSRMLQQAMSGQAPESVALERFGATVQPSEAVQVAAIQAANRQQPPESYTTLPGRPGEPVLRVGSRTNVAQPVVDPTKSAPGSLVMHPPEKMEREYTNVIALRQAAGAAGRALPAQQTLRTIETTDPMLPGRFYQKLARSQGILQKARQALMSDEQVEAELFRTLDPMEQRYWTAGKQFMAGLLRQEIGAAQTVQEFMRQKGAWFPAGEVADPALLKDFQDRRDAEIQNNIYVSGDAFADLWAPLLKSQGVDLSRYQLRGTGPVNVAPGVADPSGREPNIPKVGRSLEEIERELGIRP